MTVEASTLPPGSNRIHQQLQASRKDLLDVGLRNPLLNYRTRAKSSGKLLSKRIEVTGEDPVEVFRILVTQGRTMTFLPRPEPQPSQGQLVPASPVSSVDGEGPVVAAPEEGDDESERLTDRQLQTLLPLDRLHTELLEIHRTARTLIEEQGVNSLFLALGTLKWFEAEASEEPRLAPLILVPVTVERSNAKERFHLEYTGEEITYNRSLEALLAGEFALKLPPLTEDELDVGAYLQAVASAVAAEDRWSVDGQTIHLAFFSFAKFLMHKDLDPTAWPDSAKPEGNEVISQLLGPSGFRHAPSSISDEDFLDPLLSPREVHHVMDADSSQAVVIADAVSGRNLVVQGPPGTGKSQTITNLIAEAVGHGKRVLFVAEKMAALEVVKRRLDHVGLGDLTLELHSNKTNKKVLLAELKRTLDLTRPRQAGDEARVAALVEARDRLNKYADLVNTPMGSSGITPHDAFGLLAKSTGSVPGNLLDLPEGSLLAWSRADVDRKRGLLNDLHAWVSKNGVPHEHPFWGSKKLVHLPTDDPAIRAALQAASGPLASLGEVITQVRGALSLPSPHDLTEVGRFLAAVQFAGTSPNVTGLDLTAVGWTESADVLKAALEAGARADATHAQYGTVLKPEAWEADVTAAREAVDRVGRRWWRFLSGAYRASQRVIRDLTVGEPPREPDKQVELLDAILQVRADRQTLAGSNDLAGGLFGTRWAAKNHDWEDLKRVAAWVRALQGSVASGELPPWATMLLPTATAAAPFAATAAQAQDDLSGLRAALPRLTGLLELDEAARFGSGANLSGQPLEKLRALLEEWSQRLPELQAVARLNNLSGQLTGEGLAGSLKLVCSRPEVAGQLADSLFLDWLVAWLRATYQQHPELADFDGSDHNALVERFRDLDKLVLEYHSSRLAGTHWEKLPRSDGGGQLAVLRRQFEMKSRHLPIRQLMARAGNAIQALKPVMMMSPLSIANFLPPGAVDFDLVIFDEASQVKPADALGAILRGRQAVVVGDSKQLGPTNFFERMISGEDEDVVEEESATANIESVLGLFKAQGCPERMLRWHYRSRHESLIAVSNNLFYENKLVIFPSPNASQERSGVVYHHLAGTAYDRGGSRTNPEEAKAIVQAVLQHARTNPSLTLGVVAFSSAQMRAIEDQLELARRQFPELEAFTHQHPFEPFFVKNLETVQGDERDVILISVGYGRDAGGKLTMNFGPVNAKGGERRLNVLITRARVRCEVFTNLSADDIQTTADTPEGVRALKTFLEHAATGRMQLPSESSRGPDSPFEEAVRDALTASGYTIRAQVGTAGYFIDLAVADPEKPGRYLLGIECDGAAYHSARSARDRDRLRQQVLENLGWRLHRVWSTDWFRDPARELRKVVAAIEAARTEPQPSAEPPNGGSGGPRPPEPPDQLGPSEPGPPTGVPEYVVARPQVMRYDKELHEVPAAVLAGWLTEVVGVEGPIHVDEAASRVAGAYGVARVGSRIREAIERGIRSAVSRGTVQRRGSFLWPADLTQAPVRDRSGLPAPFRNLDLVCDEEIASALERVVRDSYGISPDEAPVAVARLLGFSRLTGEARSRVERVASSMLRSGRLAVQNEFLVMP